MNLVSDHVFGWILTALTGGVSLIWLFYDALKLWWLRDADGSDPVVHDKRFGYCIGVLIMAVGVIGCLRFHGVL